MSRWFRLDDDIINDPKILLLPEVMRWIWVAFLCIASKNSGVLPKIEIIALSLRVKTAKAAEYLTRLVTAGLIDKTETGFAPHNWNARQFKSDVSTERVKRFRKHERNVSETPPHTQTETHTQPEKKDSDANASGAEAPIDHRKRLFDEGLKKLAAMTGKGPDACRSFVGKCLKAASDDAVTVLGLIEDAERNQVVNPSAWIAARLKPVEISNGRRTVHDAANDLEKYVKGLQEPAPDGLCDGTGPGAVRFLSSR
jgi:Mn-dependent DtxR family transcriptional regulator